MNNFIKILRTPHYIKNILILLPLFFSGEFIDSYKLLNALKAFVAFSFCASAIYIFNDYHDVKSDRKHPKKKYRPLASGLISKSVALILMNILLAVGLILMFSISLVSSIFLLSYIILNLLYSFKLKQIALLDVTIIAIGFVLRLFVGSYAYNVKLSPSIVLITFLLAIFLALAKRRDDVFIQNKTGKKIRNSIDGYNLELINAAMLIMAAVVIITYLQYTTSYETINKFGNENLYLTTLFVIFGIMRYLQITFVEKNSGSPTEIFLNDKTMQINILLWFFSFLSIIYLSPS